MPTYVYKCEKCGDRFEYFQSMTAPKLTKCEKCGGELRRLIGAGAGIIFKGKGFYCTDYNGKQNPPPEHAPKKKEAESKPSTPPPASSGGESTPKAS